MMMKASRRLKQLEQELLALGGDAMLLEELDGFIAGLATEHPVQMVEALADVDRRDPRFTPERLEALTAASPGQIGPWIVTLYEWRLANCAPAPDVPTQHSSFAAPSSKVGRNDPCPCGSGKKYKKRCGLN
jgi:uncharacterized protein YecA (UPF0149 family)